MTEDEQLRLHENARRGVHHALDLWLDASERRASKAHATGRGGYIGELKLEAHIEDDEIELRSVSAFVELIP